MNKYIEQEKEKEKKHKRPNLRNPSLDPSPFWSSSKEETILNSKS